MTKKTAVAIIVKKILKVAWASLPENLSRIVMRLALHLDLKSLSFSLAINRRFRDYKTRLYTKDGLKIIVDNSTVSLSLYFLGARGYEYFEHKTWCALCKSFNGNDIYEVGCNIGYFSVFGAAAAPESSYRVYEPNKRVLRSLAKNIEINNISNIKVNKTALVGDDFGDEVLLNLPIDEKGVPATGGFVLGAEGVNRGIDTKYLVKTTKASSLRNVALMKIDAEGAEYSILNSMQQTLKNSKTIVLLELRPKAKNLLLFLLNFCDTENYSIFSFDKGLIKKIPITQVDHFLREYSQISRDVLLIPNSKIKTLSEWGFKIHTSSNMS